MKTQVIVLLLLATGTALAQQDQGESPEPPSAADFIARFDTDSDGLVSEEEFPGPPEHFSQLDADADGFISEEEAPTGPPPRGPHGTNGPPPEASCPQQAAEDGQQAGAPPSCGKDGNFIARFDRDEDGLVSAEEFPGPAEHFEQLDTDGDGYISESEAPKGPPPRKPEHSSAPSE